MLTNLELENVVNNIGKKSNNKTRQTTKIDDEKNGKTSNTHTFM